MTSSVFPIAVITFKEGLRHRILYGILVASLFLIFFAVLFSGFFMRDILKILLDFCLSCISLGGLLVPFFLAINLLGGDIEKRTIYTLLAKPISRGEYIVGKFFGLALLTGAVISILTLATLFAIYLATQLYPAHYFTRLNIPPILVAISMTFLGTLVLNGTVLLWCSVTTSTFLATLLTLSTYFIGHSAENMVRFIALQLSDIGISPTIKLINNIVLYVFPNLAAFDLKQHAAYCLPISLEEILFLVLYGSTYISATLFLTIFFFNRRDLP